jgi:hypothetical protein
MSRVEILQSCHAPLKLSDAKAVTALATMARQQLQTGSNKEAANLLRGSEHLSFAALADEGSDKIQLSDELVQSITEQFDELSEKADKHWEEHEEGPAVLTAVYEKLRKSAAKALKHGAYYQALELARAAEALAHVRWDGPHKLEDGKKPRKLTAV